MGSAMHILDVFILRDEEKNEAFGLIYQRMMAVLLAYDKETKDLLHRLKPLTN